MGTYKTTASGLAETQMSTMGSKLTPLFQAPDPINSSPAPASNLRHHWKQQTDHHTGEPSPEMCELSKGCLPAAFRSKTWSQVPPSGQRDTAFIKGVKLPNEWSTCPEPVVASQLKVVSGLSSSHRTRFPFAGPPTRPRAELSGNTGGI